MTTGHSAPEALAPAAQAAGLAPSVHNTQPWRWVVGPDRLDLYADRRRQLTHADPEGRLLMISCGAALHHARVALAAEGWEPIVETFPTSGDSDQVARLRLGEHVGTSPAAMRALQAARNRRTDRRPLTDTPVPPEAMALVRGAVEAEQCHLHLLPEDQVGELATAAARAETLEAEDDRRTAELGYWVGGARPAGAGLPDETIPVQPTQTHVPLRDFGASGTLPVGTGGDRFATYAVLFGEEDTPAGWVRAGAALSAAWLTATGQGVALLPFSAPVETAVTRLVLRRLLAGLGHPYLVLRLGVPDPEHPGPPHTPRLDPTHTVEFTDN